jgi:VanZ family protein
VFIGTHLPLRGRGPIVVEHADKVVHFLLFFTLSVLGARYWHARAGAGGLAALLPWAAIYASYAVLDEWLQQFVGRDASLGDWIADVLGINAGTAVAMWLRVGAVPSEPKKTEPGAA